jgi:hypothetical protein
MIIYLLHAENNIVPSETSMVASHNPNLHWYKDRIVHSFITASAAFVRTLAASHRRI